MSSREGRRRRARGAWGRGATPTRSEGAKRASSRCQLPTRLVGITTRLGSCMRPACFLGRQVGDGLQRLAEPHVVGEHAAGAAARAGAAAKRPLLAGTGRSVGESRPMPPRGRSATAPRPALCPARGRARRLRARRSGRSPPRTASSSLASDAAWSAGKLTKRPVERLLALVELDEHFEQLRKALRRKHARWRWSSTRTAPKAGREPAERVEAGGTLRVVRADRAAPAKGSRAARRSRRRARARTNRSGPRRGRASTRELAVDDLVGVVVVDLDAKAERPELRHRVGGERAPSVDVAIELDEVVGLRVGGRRVLGQTGHLDGTEALENAPRVVLADGYPDPPPRARHDWRRRTACARPKSGVRVPS